MKSSFIRMTSYVRAGEALERHAAVFPPRRPSRRASAPLSRYDRLDPAARPEPSPGPAQSGPRARVDGMERLRDALDRLAVKMEAAKPSLDEFTRAMAAARAAGRRGL